MPKYKKRRIYYKSDDYPELVEHTIFDFKIKSFISYQNGIFSTAGTNKTFRDRLKFCEMYDVYLYTCSYRSVMNHILNSH